MRLHQVIRSNGFTLVELLLVVAILGIIAVFTAPHIAPMLSGSRISVGAREVASAGRYARTLALMNQRPVDFIINQSAGSFSVKAVLTENDSENFDVGSMTGGQRSGSLTGGFGIATSKNSKGYSDLFDKSPPPSYPITDTDDDISFSDDTSSASMDVDKTLEGIKIRFKGYRDTSKSRRLTVSKMYKTSDTDENGVVVIRYRANGTVRPYMLYVVNEADEKDYIAIEVNSIGTPKINKESN